MLRENPGYVSSPCPVDEVGAAAQGGEEDEEPENFLRSRRRGLKKLWNPMDGDILEERHIARTQDSCNVRNFVQIRNLLPSAVPT